jgi:aryl-alcohol dehydrogenase-like predicted oxidoreductase
MRGTDGKTGTLSSDASPENPVPHDHPVAGDPAVGECGTGASLAFHPDTGELWALVQERDGLGDNLPSGYMIRVRKNRFHGRPHACMGKYRQTGFANLAPGRVQATSTQDLSSRRKQMPDLPKRELGRTGLQVTMLGYGAMELRGAPRARPTTEEQAETILNAVLDAGINYIDTSIDYGVSEERIGRYISHRRSEYYLASKCGCLVGAPAAPAGQVSQHVFTRDNIIAGVEQSLVRMKTDYLDLVQFHISPSKQTLEGNGAVEAVMELKEAGKVRFIGMSGTLPHLKDHIAMGVFDVFQIPYSAMEREHEAIIAMASEAGSGIVIRGGAAKGAPSDGKQRGLQWERWQRARLEDLLGDMTPMEFILRFTFSNPDLDTTIVGTANPAHLRDNVEILRKGPLPVGVYTEAKRRLAAAGSAPSGA